MINVDDWAEIRRLHSAEHLGIKTIARQLGVARNTVRTALRSDAPPHYERQGRGSLVDAFDGQIRTQLDLFRSELWRKELGNRATDHALFTRRTIDEAIDEIKRVARQQRGER